MPSLYNARSVNPAHVTAADLAAVCEELGLNPAGPAPADFFLAGATYTRRLWDGTEVFHVAIVARLRGGSPIAVGYFPVNLVEGRCWEFGTRNGQDWARGWTLDPSAVPTDTTNPTTEGA